MSSDPQHIPIPDRRAEMVWGLRDLADYLEGHPEIPVPNGARVGRHLERDEFIAAAIALGGDIAAHVAGGGYATATRGFGPMGLVIQTDLAALLEGSPPVDRTEQVRRVLAEAQEGTVV